MNPIKLLSLGWDDRVSSSSSIMPSGVLRCRGHPAPSTLHPAPCSPPRRPSGLRGHGQQEVSAEVPPVGILRAELQEALCQRGIAALCQTEPACGVRGRQERFVLLPSRHRNAPSALAACSEPRARLVGASGKALQSFRHVCCSSRKSRAGCAGTRAVFPVLH